mmetsp:Transcript_1961/g.5434  ORF Transcript_1961/g.5434 Transcript_1961/m.5434 type:complete len:208 (+) Transcript_1961:47-670(+)
MMKVIIAVLATLTVVSSAWEEPAFCKGLNCPVFETVYSDPEANVTYRVYEGALWASTNITSISYEDAVNEGFNRLFDYISGANEGNVKIDMTTPVDTKVLAGPGPFCESTFVVSFYVPYIYQDDANPPPEPTNPDVYIQYFPQSKKAQYGFDGYAFSFKKWIEPTQYLFNYLVAQGESFESEFYYTNGYDSPFAIFSRHNEVWVDLL